MKTPFVLFKVTIFYTSFLFTLRGLVTAPPHYRWGLAPPRHSALFKRFAKRRRRFDRAERVKLAEALALSDADVVKAARAFHSRNVVTVNVFYYFVHCFYFLSLSGFSPLRILLYAILSHLSMLLCHFVAFPPFAQKRFAEIVHFVAFSLRIGAYSVILPVKKGSAINE